MRAAIILRSPLTPAEAERALREAISREPPLGIPLLAKRGSKGILGKVGDGRIRIHFLPVIHNSASPVFRGRVLPEGGGSRVEGGFGVHYAVLLPIAFIAYFLLGLSAMGIALIVLGDEEPEGGVWKGFVFLGLALGMGLFTRFVWFSCRRFAADEENMLLLFLRNTLQVEAVSTPLSPPGNH